jgi:acetyl esterase
LLGGDSAGANLAANCICTTAEATHPEALMLMYPMTDHPDAQHASYTEHFSASPDSGPGAGCIETP